MLKVLAQRLMGIPRSAQQCMAPLSRSPTSQPEQIQGSREVLRARGTNAHRTAPPPDSKTTHTPPALPRTQHRRRGPRPRRGLRGRVYQIRRQPHRGHRPTRYAVLCAGGGEAPSTVRGGRVSVCARGDGGGVAWPRPQLMTTWTPATGSQSGPTHWTRPLYSTGRSPYTVGLIFGLRRKKFVGSYLFFRATNRS